MLTHRELRENRHRLGTANTHHQTTATFKQNVYFGVFFPLLILTYHHSNDQTLLTNSSQPPAQLPTPALTQLSTPEDSMEVIWCRSDRRQHQALERCFGVFLIQQDINKHQNWDQSATGLLSQSCILLVTGVILLS